MFLVFPIAVYVKLWSPVFGPTNHGAFIWINLNLYITTRLYSSVSINSISDSRRRTFFKSYLIPLFAPTTGLIKWGINFLCKSLNLLFPMIISAKLYSIFFSMMKRIFSWWKLKFEKVNHGEQQMDVKRW